MFFLLALFFENKREAGYVFSVLSEEIRRKKNIISGGESTISAHKACKHTDKHFFPSMKYKVVPYR